MKLVANIYKLLFPFTNFKKRSDALKPFQTFKWYKVDLKPYLNRFSKPRNDQIGNQKKQKYRLRMSSDMGCDYRSDGPYRDASYTMALYVENGAGNYMPRREDYLACIGFDVIENGRVIKILQIQGAPKKSTELSILKWERMLLSILTNWAKENRFTEVRVIQAKDQRWYIRYSQDKDHTKRMFLHYDVTARRSGFYFKDKLGCYVTKLA